MALNISWSMKEEIHSGHAIRHLLIYFNITKLIMKIFILYRITRPRNMPTLLTKRLLNLDNSVTMLP
jgi:hypothetical protein